MEKKIMETQTVKENKSQHIDFDIDAIVKLARESYDKKEAGLAKQLVTGADAILSSEDEDFVIWSRNSFWQDLTNLKGIPIDRFVQISGKPDSGKSSCALQFIVDAQKQGFIVIMVDTEKKFSKFRFEKMGGNYSKLLRIATSNIVDSARAIASYTNSVKTKHPAAKIFIVVDSIGAGISSTEDNEESESFSKQPGVAAKETNFLVRKIVKLMNKHTDLATGKGSIAALAINQTYSSIGMGAPTQIERGGTGLAYQSSIIIQLSRKQDLTRVKGGDKYKFGIVSRAKVKKNHLADSEESIAELDIVVSASGIQLAKDVKGVSDLQGWDETEDDQ